MVKPTQRAMALLGIGLLTMTGVPPAAQQSFVEQSLVLNVEVPVRVFKQDRFLDDLRLEDFKLSEDGVPQDIDVFEAIG